MKLNAYLAIILSLSLMIGEIIRSYGKNRAIFSVLDDFFFGGILLVGAILTLRKNKHGIYILTAGWSSVMGMCYGSFFSKLNNLSENFESNINQNFLTFLIGLALLTSIFGLLWSFYNIKRTS